MVVKNSTKITSAVSVKNMKPRPARYEVAVDEYPGLRMRISPVGKKVWFYRFRDPITGKLDKVTIGVYPSTSMKDAKDEYERLKSLRDSGVNPKLAVRAEDEEIARERAQEAVQASATVQALANDYIDHASTVKRSWKEDRRILEREMVPTLGGKPACAVTRADIRELLENIRGRGAPIQANRALAIIRKMFNWALENDWPNPTAPLQFNPCQGLKVTKEAPRQRALNDAELRRVLKGLPETDIPVDHQDLILFVLLTGCRIGEAVAMKWGDVHDDQWRLPAAKTKNGREHIVYLSPQTREILDRRPESKGWVWPNPKTSTGHVREEAVQKALLPLRSCLKIEKFTAHDLRRTLATWLGDQQVDEAVHDRILNHVTGGIRRVYNTSKYNRPARDWWHRWGQHISSLRAENVKSIKGRGRSV